MMNEYEFEYVANQYSWHSTYRVWAPNKPQAYEDFAEYLEGRCDIDPATVIVVDCYVINTVGGEEDEIDNF